MIGVTWAPRVNTIKSNRISAHKVVKTLQGGPRLVLSVLLPRDVYRAAGESRDSGRSTRLVQKLQSRFRPNRYRADFDFPSLSELIVPCENIDIPLHQSNRVSRTFDYNMPNPTCFSSPTPCQTTEQISDIPQPTHKAPSLFFVVNDRITLHVPVSQQSYTYIYTRFPSGKYLGEWRKSELMLV